MLAASPIERRLWNDVLYPRRSCQELLQSQFLPFLEYSAIRYRQLGISDRLKMLQEVSDKLWLSGDDLEKNWMPRGFPLMSEAQVANLAEKLDLFFVNLGPIEDEDILTDIGIVGVKLVVLSNGPSKVSRAYYHFLRRATRLIVAKPDKTEVDFDLAARLEGLMASTNLQQLGRVRNTKAILSQSMGHLAEATLYDELGFKQGLVLEPLLRFVARLLVYWPSAGPKDRDIVGEQIVQSIGGILSWSSIVFSETREKDLFEHLRIQSFLNSLERLSQDAQLEAFPVARDSLGLLVGVLNGIHGVPKNKLN